MNSRVSIIILNWNGWKDTLECLESVYRIDYPSYDIVLLDNGSKDDSIPKIKDYLLGSVYVDSKFFSYRSENKPISLLELSKEEAEAATIEDETMASLPSDRRLTLIKNDQNYGFAEGNNIGIRYALKALNPDYLLLLNNDTVVDRSFLSELVEVAEGDESSGFVGPKVFYYDSEGRSDIISVVGINLLMKKGYYNRIGNSEIDFGQHDDIRVVDYIEGSCLLARAEVFRKIGFLNSRYFAYWEEADLCIRGAEAGYRSICAPGSRIWHKVSASSPSSLKLYYMTRNRLWFMRAHAERKDLASFYAYFFTSYFAGTLGRFILKKDAKKTASFIRGVIDGLR